MVDFVFERVELNKSEESYKHGGYALEYLLEESPEYGQHIVKRLLAVALDAPDDSAENSFAWNTLQQRLFKYLPEPLKKIIDRVIERGNDDDWYETVSQALAVIPDAEIPPTFPDTGKLIRTVVNSEEMLIALIEGENELL